MGKRMYIGTILVVVAFILLLVGSIISGCITFPDSEPRCPSECEEVRQGDDLMACKCDPDFLNNFITEEECEEQKVEYLQEECE